MWGEHVYYPVWRVEGVNVYADNKGRSNAQASVSCFCAPDNRAVVFISCVAACTF